MLIMDLNGTRSQPLAARSTNARTGACRSFRSKAGRGIASPAARMDASTSPAASPPYDYNQISYARMANTSTSATARDQRSGRSTPVVLVHGRSGLEMFLA